MATRPSSTRLAQVDSLGVIAAARPHAAAVCCLTFCEVGPTGLSLLSAATDGEVRIVAVGADRGEGGELVPIALLRPATGVGVHCLDVLPPSASDGCPHWLVGSEHQQVQVWPLIEAALAPAAAPALAELGPLVTLELEPEALLVVPSELASLGWRCIAAFCPHHPPVVACCGLTRERRLLFYDFVQRSPLVAVPLQEWPTALAFSHAAPLLALGGASGRVKLISFEEHALYPAVGRAELDVIDVALHTHAVRSLHFSGSALHSASDEEVAEWQLPFVIE